jgi:soluble lytic murein transglycosylase
VWRARAIARAGDVPRAIEALEAVADGRWGRTSVYARYLAALLLEDEDDLAAARRQFDRVARADGHPRYANPSLWYLGWTAWRAGDAAEARARFAELAARERANPIGRLRAVYWQARAAARLGDDEAAQAGYREVLGTYPLTYYGWLATHRLVGDVPPSRPAAFEPGPRAVKPAELARARILLEAGLRDEAAFELRLTARRARGLRDRVDVGRLLAEAGAYHHAQRLVVDRYYEDLARGVAPGHEPLWWLAWPIAFGPLVEALHPSDASIDPEVVSAVMREESGYRPDVTSPAGARGLLQIMPETGRRLAVELGLEGFDPYHLYRPRTNIRLGAFYLDQLTRRFDGRLVASVASYNAGPNAVARWIAEQPGLEDDEWTEAIPYSQTRGYVKRVMRSVHVYRALY